MWLESPAFQEELVKSPTFHNFADPILHNIVVKDIFAWVYLVSTEQITNRMSLQIIKIGYNSSEMDRDRYSGNCLFKVEACNGEEEEELKNIFFWGGGGGEVAPHTAPSMRYSERRWTSRFALIGMYVRRSLKNEWKRKLYDSKNWD